ncbi:MAG TPA: glycerate kinase [Bacillota bacterium]
MRIVVAVDKFKGSLSAREAARHIAAGLRRGWRDLAVEELPLSDGGEGFLDMLLRARGGTAETVVVAGPLGDPVPARLGLLAGEDTAVVEAAEACGLWRLPGDQRDPWRATSRGVGDLIRAALQAGRRRILVGIGGTASSDGGAGLARSLGVRLLDARGHDVADGAQGLLDVAVIDPRGLDRRLHDAVITAACDVNNPLCGPRGAAAVFGPQKGLAPGDVPLLDRALADYARRVEATMPRRNRDRRDNDGQRRGAAATASLAERPGTGAGGGIAFALAAFARAALVSGAQLALSATGAGRRFASADLVVTGEGRLDESSLLGKLPMAVTQAARRRGVPVVAICGQVALSEDRWREAGLDAVVPLGAGPATSPAPSGDAQERAEAAGCRIASLLRRGLRPTGLIQP